MANNIEPMDDEAISFEYVPPPPPASTANDRADEDTSMDDAEPLQPSSAINDRDIEATNADRADPPLQPPPSPRPRHATPVVSPSTQFRSLSLEHGPLTQSTLQSLDGEPSGAAPPSPRPRNMNLSESSYRSRFMGMEIVRAPDILSQRSFLDDEEPSPVSPRWRSVEGYPAPRENSRPANNNEVGSVFDNLDRTKSSQTTSLLREYLSTLAHKQALDNDGFNVPGLPASASPTSSWHKRKLVLATISENHHRALPADSHRIGTSMPSEADECVEDTDMEPPPPPGPPIRKNRRPAESSPGTPAPMVIANTEQSGPLVMVKELDSPTSPPSSPPPYIPDEPPEDYDPDEDYYDDYDPNEDYEGDSPTSNDPDTPDELIPWLTSKVSPTDTKKARRERQRNPLLALDNPLHGTTTYATVPCRRQVEVMEQSYQLTVPRWGVDGDTRPRGPRGSTNGRYLEERNAMRRRAKAMADWEYSRNPDYRFAFHAIDGIEADKRRWKEKLAILARNTHGNRSAWLNEAWGPPLRDDTGREVTAVLSSDAARNGGPSHHKALTPQYQGMKRGRRLSSVGGSERTKKPKKEHVRFTSSEAAEIYRNEQERLRSDSPEPPEIPERSADRLERLRLDTPEPPEIPERNPNRPKRMGVSLPPQEKDDDDVEVGEMRDLNAKEMSETLGLSAEEIGEMLGLSSEEIEQQKQAMKEIEQQKQAMKEFEQQKQGKKFEQVKHAMKKLEQLRHAMKEFEHQKHAMENFEPEKPAMKAIEQQKPAMKETEPQKPHKPSLRGQTLRERTLREQQAQDVRDNCIILSYDLRDKARTIAYQVVYESSGVTAWYPALHDLLKGDEWTEKMKDYWYGDDAGHESRTRFEAARGEDPPEPGPYRRFILKASLDRERDIVYYCRDHEVRKPNEDDARYWKYAQDLGPE